MTLTERLKGVAIALLILLACFPAAMIITILTSALWSWIETYFKIEAYGHSGPAEWCYLVVFVVLVTICTFIWSRKNRKRKGGSL